MLSNNDSLSDMYSFSELQRFTCKAGETVRISMIGDASSIVEITDLSGKVSTHTVPNDYLEDAVLKSRLRPFDHLMYVIQRNEDKKFYKSAGHWVKTIHRAQQFTDDAIDSVLSVMLNRKYDVQKVVF